MYTCVLGFWYTSCTFSFFACVNEFADQRMMAPSSDAVANMASVTAWTQRITCRVWEEGGTEVQRSGPSVRHANTDRAAAERFQRTTNRHWHWRGNGRGTHVSVGGQMAIHGDDGTKLALVTLQVVDDGFARGLADGDQAPVLDDQHAVDIRVLLVARQLGHQLPCRRKDGDLGPGAAPEAKPEVAGTLNGAAVLGDDGQASTIVHVPDLRRQGRAAKPQRRSARDAR